MREGIGKVRAVSVAAALLTLFVIAQPRQAWAVTCSECTCDAAEQSLTQAYVAAQNQQTRTYFGTSGSVNGAGQGTGQLGETQNHATDTVFITNLNSALQMMSEQFVTTMMSQAMIIGSFLDAKQQLETQLLLQKLTAEAHKDYQPSAGMCAFATNIRSLGMSDHTASLTRTTLSQRAIQRQLGEGVALGSLGADDDRSNRFGQFATRFCDINDNNRLAGVANTGLQLICAGNVRSNLANLNRDVDFTRMVADPDTMLVDMADPARGRDTESAFAMQANLYGHDLMSRIPRTLLNDDASMDEVVDFRSVLAKRSIAEASFNTIVGLKAMGSTGDAGLNSTETMKYMTFLLKDLGIAEEEIPGLIASAATADEARPSYYAQLRLLAKRIYQRPDFYIDLYDTPANVKRKKVAMQGINSILEREIHESRQRSEAILSQILELKVARRQKAVENQLGGASLEKQ